MGYNNSARDNRMAMFFDWATTGPQAPQYVEPRGQYQSSSSTGSSNNGYYAQRGRANSGSGGYGRPYGPSASYDYHRRSPSPPHHQEARGLHARGAGYRGQASHRGAYHGGGYRGGHGARYDAYPRRGDYREEERLRARALQGRIKTPPPPAVPWVRSVYPTDIAEAEPDGNGHPVCPLESGDGDDEDDYGSDSEIPSLPSGWKTTELARQADAVAHEERGRKYTRHKVEPSDAIGRWLNKTIDTKDEAANVLRWIARTEPSAFHFMHCERVRLGSDPTITRTEGQVYLLQRQNAASVAYWMATTGRRKGPSRYEAPPAFEDPGQRAEEDQYAYLGTAILGDEKTFVIVTELADGDSEVRSGSHTRLIKAVRLYEEMEHRLWPLGFRVNEREYAPPRDRFARPFANDVLAWYTINALAPRRNRVGTSVERAKFMEILIRLLSVAGTFNRVAQIGEYVDASRALEHYPFITFNITFSHVVGWLVQHGIRRDGDAIKTLESFARARRNVKEDKVDPNGITFKYGGSPHHEKEMLALAMGPDFCHWRDLIHAGLQSNVTSEYPAQPSIAMDQA
ncbi:hypothetical protein DFH06DRAFT_1150828 [Mycena polygramma]|nr:hypothetical protein DFH06DRAFT_1150828 [Mycena polygramma]